jgi:hypothetical protein
MTSKATVENLLDQILALPDAAQAEIVQALVESQAEDFEIYRGDDDQQVAATRGRA